MARITMPQLGETVTEGTVTRWLKELGDHVEVDEPLLEVSTDKVDTEVPAAAAGVLRSIEVAEGETVPIGSVLCHIGDEDDVARPGDTPAGADGDASSSRTTLRGAMVGFQARLGAPPPRVPAAPPHRRDDHQVDRRGAEPARMPLGDAPAPSTPLPHLAVAERIPFSTVRRRTATHLHQSLSTAAHTLTTTAVDYSAVERARAGTDLSYLPFIARAVCDALTGHPRMNASVGEDEVVVWAPVHLGIAVDLDHDGLVVPVIRDAPSLRLHELARTMAEVADGARRRTLGADAYAEGTFTITNAGAYGTVVTAPIINTPQVGILSVDGIAPRPVAVPAGEGWAVAVRTAGNLSLSFDHRAVDGAYATAFLAEVRVILETRDWDAELGGRR